MFSKPPGKHQNIFIIPGFLLRASVLFFSSRVFNPSSPPLHIHFSFFPSYSNFSLTYLGQESLPCFFAHANQICMNPIDGGPKSKTLCRHETTRGGAIWCRRSRQRCHVARTVMVTMFLSLFNGFRFI